MKITRIYRGKKSNRINIDVDEKFVLSIEENTLVKFNLYKGKDTTKKELVEIEKYDAFAYAWQKALDLISRRLKTKAEIEKYLQSKLKRAKKANEDQREVIIKETISKLVEKGFIDEKEYVRLYIESKKRLKRKSRREIEQGLFKKGISKEVYNPIIQKLLPADTDSQTIENLIERKLRASKMMQLDRQEQKQKIYAYLSRKGFGYDLIKNASEKYFNSF